MSKFFLPLVAIFTLPLVNSNGELTFEKDIRPIFRVHCFDCHGATDRFEGGLDLRLVRFMLKGGKSGPVIDPGDASASYLLQRVIDGEMPPGEHRVPDEQIATIESWIIGGAKIARPEPKSIGRGLRVTPEERKYWAFQPIRRSPVPPVVAARLVRTPIDAFLLSRMEPVGLTFASEAEKVTLIRRAYLDLIGLPPRPEHVKRFLADDSIDNWESVINELLASPHYGERWGRHWLDVAGYADSEGSEEDSLRPWSYKYRDWVIHALNQDMPFDEFITWQLAGDELTERPLTNMSSQQIEKLVATGFLRMAADGTESKNDDETRNQVMTDTIKIVSSSLLGLSVGCAQCHDHRYDPISQVDYFRLRAVFEPAINYKQWIQPAGRRISLYTDDDIATSQIIEEEAKVVAAERAQKQNEFMEAALTTELAKLEDSLRQQVEDAYRASVDQRTEEQKVLLANHPHIAKLSPGVLYQYNKKDADKIKEFDKQIAEIRGKKPVEEFLRVLTEPHGSTPPSTQLFYRGDYRQPQFEVKPGGLSVAAPRDHPFVIADDDKSISTSGRRLAYARWLTNGRHPLVARVLVNRFWFHHFGKAFVATPDEFGKLGSLPDHPELLDWLADEFMAQGWSLKRLHRLIMTSTAYRQQSLSSKHARDLDGANHLYSHFPVRRLEAEAIRDSILAVSGRLDRVQFGPSVAASVDDTGQIITTGDRQRRSIYLQICRTKPVAFLKSFDAPVMKVNCGKRESSTVATQSLMLMNSDFILKSSLSLAERLANDKSESISEQIVYCWQLAYGRMPSHNELAFAEEYYDEQRKLLETREHESADKQAITNLAQALLSSNEFLYVE